MSVKRNIVANLIGSVWGAIVVLTAIPFYISFLGVEAYGLVGFFATLQILFSVLEMGMSAVIQREFAKWTGAQSDTEGLSNLIRVLALIYWVIALFIVVLIFVLAAWLSENWLNITSLSMSDARTAIVLMGCSIAVRYPSVFYSGGMLGLQKQVTLSWIKAVTDTARGGGTVLVLWLVSPTINAFFLWQIVVELINTLALRKGLQIYFPHHKYAKGLQFKQIQKIWKFAAGMSGISVLVVILMQLDKVILSGLLSLEAFGYYTIAGSLSLGLTLVIRPIFSATYPRLTQLVEADDQDRIKYMYHGSCQLMTVMIIPLALVISFFSKEILYLWTNNTSVVMHAYSLLSILIIGTALNGLMNIPYALQLAHGWTSLTFYMNVIAVIVLAPLIIIMTRYYGAVGAALVWVLLNSGYVLIGIQFMHRRLLPYEKGAWYLDDIILPVVGALIVIWPARLLIIDEMTKVELIVSLGAILCMAVLSSAMMSSLIRDNLIRRFRWIFRYIRSEDG